MAYMAILNGASMFSDREESGCRVVCTTAPDPTLRNVPTARQVEPGALLSDFLSKAQSVTGRRRVVGRKRHKMKRLCTCARWKYCTKEMQAGGGVVTIGAIRGTRSDASDCIPQRPDRASPSFCWLSVLSLDNYSARPTSDVPRRVDTQRIPRFRRGGMADELSERKYKIQFSTHPLPPNNAPTG